MTRSPNLGAGASGGPSRAPLTRTAGWLWLLLLAASMLAFTYSLRLRQQDWATAPSLRTAPAALAVPARLAL
ncbi:MAG: hypothetical protein ACRD01_13805 [Terriglobales bacterium]